MEKLKDDIHHCDNCDIFPCSSQEIVSKSDICNDCPSRCCNEVIVPLAPCEELKLGAGKGLGLKMRDNGWCWYYDKDKGCTIYDIRPVMCRIATCRFIREGKIPEEIKMINEKRERDNKK